MIKNLSLIISFISLSLLPSHSSLYKMIDSVKSKYANDHFLIKLKKDKLYASSSAVTYENLIYEIAALSDIKITAIKRIFPPDLKNNCELYEIFELNTFFAVYIEEKTDILRLCEKFSSSPYVDFAEPDFIGEAAGRKNTVKPNDEYFSRQWALFNDGTIKTSSGKPGKLNADMNVLKGWEITSGSEGVIVAILDSGVKTDHPDLSDRLWKNAGETKNGIDDDKNGFIDDIFGYNFAYDNSNVRDDGGHGTNIAGTIGASTNNRIGYAGIDQKCKLMICKNLDSDNSGEYSWWAASLYYAANNGANIINMSEGGYDYSKTLATAVKFAQEKGCLIIASMMNKNNNDSYYPASLPDVIAVGATDTDDSRCKQFTWGGGSNWGKHISVVAPGNRIYGLDHLDNFNYDIYWSGTSQSTAYVSGIAALLLAQNPSRDSKTLREIITSTARDQVGDPKEDKPGWDQYHGWGRVDLYAALTYENTHSGRNNKSESELPDEEIINKDKGGIRAKAQTPSENKQDDDNRRARKPRPGYR